jgi:hypothetical protein
MLGFGRKEEGSPECVEEQIVDDLDAEFASWTLAQQRAFAQILCRLLPAIAAEGDGAAAALPLDRVAAIVKQSFLRLAGALAWNASACAERLGQAFLARGPTIRNFCAETARTIPELNGGALLAPPPTPAALAASHAARLDRAWNEHERHEDDVG